MNNHLNYMLLQNTIYNYLVSLIIILGGFLFIKLFKYLFFEKIISIMEKWSNSFTKLFRQALENRVIQIIYIILIYIAVNRLLLNEILNKILNISLLIFATIYSILLIQDILIYFLQKYWQKKEDFENKETLLNLTKAMIKIITFILAFLFILDNLDIKLTGLITGLGIGGIAIAFAAQAILADIFSYFTIFVDRPFDIGDFIVIGNYKGTVEHIGIKTTRIRSLSGEQLIFSNNDLTNSRINNYKRMERRRINFTLGVTYQTDSEKLEKIPEIIENIISSLDKLTFDRAKFASFGDYSLIFDVVYFVEDSDYQFYMLQQEKINLNLKRRFSEEGIEFAYPTQSIYMQNDDIQKNNITNNESDSASDNKNGADDRT